MYSAGTYSVLVFLKSKLWNYNQSQAVENVGN